MTDAGLEGGCCDVVVVVPELELEELGGASGTELSDR